MLLQKCLQVTAPLCGAWTSVFAGFFPGGGKKHGKKRKKTVLEKIGFGQVFSTKAEKKTPGFWTAKSGKNLEKIGFGQVFSAVLEKIPFSRPKCEH